MLTRSIAVLACAATALVLLLTAPTQAQMTAITRTDYLTFRQPVRLPNAVLTPGKYTFEALVGTGLDVVRVTTHDGRKVLFTGFTTPVTRRSRGAVVVFGEVPAGAPQPIAVWYERGGKVGHQFQY
jgi:hypothetical protein